MVGVAEIREQLLKEDNDFRRLADEHQKLESRLEELQTRRWLSDKEQLEEVKLKKEKLAVKDRMESIVRGAVAS